MNIFGEDKYYYNGYYWLYVFLLLQPIGINQQDAHERNSLHTSIHTSIPCTWGKFKSSYVLIVTQPITKEPSDGWRHRLPTVPLPIMYTLSCKAHHRPPKHNKNPRGCCAINRPLASWLWLPFITSEGYHLSIINLTLQTVFIFILLVYSASVFCMCLAEREIIIFLHLIFT